MEYETFRTLAQNAAQNGHVIIEANEKRFGGFNLTHLAHDLSCSIGCDGSTRQKDILRVQVMDCGCSQKMSVEKFNAILAKGTSALNPPLDTVVHIEFAPHNDRLETWDIAQITTEGEDVIIRLKSKTVTCALMAA